MSPPLFSRVEGFLKKTKNNFNKGRAIKRCLGGWGGSSKGSRCSFSVLLGWANAFKMPDQHKYQKKGFLNPTKCLERVLKYSYLVLIIQNYQFPKTKCVDFLCWSCILIVLAHTLIAIAHTLIAWTCSVIALAHPLIALTHINSTKKLHRLKGGQQAN